MSDVRTSVSKADAVVAAKADPAWGRASVADNAGQRRGLQSAMWLILVVEILLFAGLFVGYGLTRWHHQQAFAYGHGFLDAGWGLISLALLLLGSLIILGALWSARQGWCEHALVLLGLTLMCGMLFLGVKGIEYQHKLHTPEVWTSLFGAEEPAAVAAAEDVEAEAATEVGDEATSPDEADALVELTSRQLRGQQLYMRSCLACHGAHGEGIAGVGSPVAGTTFMHEHDDAELVSFLKEGRMPGSPDSVMGGYMPPRGGNPSLGDDELSMIVEYMRSLEEMEQADDGDTGPVLPRTILADAAQGPSGLRAEFLISPDYPLAAWWGDGDAPHAYASVEQPTLRADLFFGFYFLTTGLQALHLAGGMVLVGYLVWRTQQGGAARDRLVRSIGLAGYCWHLAGVIWLAVFGLFYLAG